MYGWNTSFIMFHLVSFWDGLFSGAMLVLGSVSTSSSLPFLKPSEQLTSLAASPCRWYKPCRVPFPSTVAFGFAQVVLGHQPPKRPRIPRSSLKNDAVLDICFSVRELIFVTTNLKQVDSCWFYMVCYKVRWYNGMNSDSTLAAQRQPQEVGCINNFWLLNPFAMYISNKWIVSFQP